VVTLLSMRLLERKSFYWACQVDICLYEPQMASWYMDERVLMKCQKTTILIAQAKSTRRLIVVDLGVIKNNNNNDTVVFGSRHLTLLRPIEYGFILCTLIREYKARMGSLGDMVILK
jgi:hypothetical protein